MNQVTPNPSLEETLAEQLHPQHGGDTDAIAAALLHHPFFSARARRSIWAEVGRIHGTPLPPLQNAPLLLPFPIASGTSSTSTSLPRPLPPSISKLIPSATSPYKPRDPGEVDLPWDTLERPLLESHFGFFARSIYAQPRAIQPLSPSQARRLKMLRKDRRLAVKNDAKPGRAPRTTWRVANKEDMAFGPLSRDGGASFAPTTFEPKTAIIILTTFPVGPHRSTILEAADSTAASPKWASTARKLFETESLLLPDKVIEQVAWVDSNPSPRPAGEGTRADDEMQFRLFKYSSRIIDLFEPKVLLVTQVSNRTWILSRVAPLWVRSDIPPITEDLFSCACEELDPYWEWGSLQDDINGTPPNGARPITLAEEQLYFYHHVLDVSAMFPAGPLALFVQNYHGKYNTILLFSPHPCNVDPLRYPRDTALSACDEIERAYGTISFLFSHPPPDIEPLDIEPPEIEPHPVESTILSQYYGGDLISSAYLSSRRYELGTLGSLIALRAEELRSGLPLDTFLTLPLRSLAAHHLLGSEQPDDLTSYVPRRDPEHRPPSILHDLLSHISSLRLNGLVERERKEEQARAGRGPPISVLDQRVLDDARASEMWDKKLRRLGVEPMYFLPGFPRFQRALTLRKRAQRPLGWNAVTSRRESASKAGEGAVLYWSAHLEDDEGDGAHLWLRLCSEDPHRAGTIMLENDRRSAVKSCAACAAIDMPACVVPVETAVALGVIYAFHEPDEVLVELQAWEKALEDQVRFGTRDAVRAQLRNAVQGWEEAFELVLDEGEQAG